MNTIEVRNLVKIYQVLQKEPGLAGSIRSLFSRKYDQIKAVAGITFNVQEGELVGFIGPNGAGKTTTLKCLSGLLFPDSGQIKVLGSNPWERKAQFLKQIAFVMGQKNQLWWDLPPIETFLLNKEIYEVPNVSFKKTLNELVELLDVKKLLKTPVKKLSLGQRMKCELIASLIHLPKVLFLDEPTIGLDVVMQKNLRQFIKEYNRRYHSTIILTSHYMKDVQELAKRVIVINHGKIIFDGLLAVLVKKYAPYKHISITLKERVDQQKIKKFGEIRTFQFPKLVFRIPDKTVNQSIIQITNSLSIDDLKVEDAEIEEVIGKVFEAKRR